MNVLYITQDTEFVKDISKQYAEDNNLYWHCFKNGRKNMIDIVQLYNDYDDCVIFLEGLTKSDVSNALLKVLEETNKNIHMYATCSSYDVRKALKSRFIVCYTDCTHNEAKEFIRTRKATKEQYSSLAFYISLAEFITYNNINMIHNMNIINTIIKNARLTTNNTPWDYYYYRLKNEFWW